jgi:hypothetical protein
MRDAGGAGSACRLFEMNLKKTVFLAFGSRLSCLRAEGRSTRVSHTHYNVAAAPATTTAIL